MNQIPMLDLKREYEFIKDEIDLAIKKCLEHQKWILGNEVNELENNIAEYLGVKHCIGVSSGTDALVLSLRALAIKLKGEEYFERTDEIITTSFTFTATGDAILRAGATPLFVDIDSKTFNIDPAKIKSYLTNSNRKHSTNPSQVIGIIPVHLYGQACNMDSIMKIAEEYSLFVLEDVAQAFGGMWNKQKLGSIGAAGAFSFFPTKNLGCFGDGGMVATNDEEIDELVRMLLKHGGKDKHYVEHIGYNSRLDTIQAAILLIKFKYVDEFNERRRQIAEIYTRELSGLTGLNLPLTFPLSPIPDIYHVYHQYTIRLTNGYRDKLKRYLKEKGISTMVYYPIPLHRMKVFEGRCNISGILEHTMSAANEVLSLPVEPLYTDEVTNRIIGAIRNNPYCNKTIENTMKKIKRIY